MKKKIRIITHSGNFHADELLAVAAIEIQLNGTLYEVIRTRDPEVWKTGDYVVDVGGVYDPTANRFDHHQKGGAGERNKVPYSSFGLVWKHYGEAICGSKEVADGVEARLVYPIDLADVNQDGLLDLVSSGDKVVITAGIPLSIRGTTNILRIAKLP